MEKLGAKVIIKERENNNMLVLGWQFWFQTSAFLRRIALLRNEKSAKYQTQSVASKLDSLLFSRS